MGTNPAVVSMPDGSRVRAALSKCDFVVVSDVTRTDTTRHSDVLLPAAAWGEKDGTVTNFERRLSRQRPFQPPPGAAKADWRIVCDVAARMGFGEAFGYQSPVDIFREHAALSAFENDGERLFDLGGLADLSNADYAVFSPRHWPASDRGEQTRLFGDGRFPTPDGRARFVPVRQEATAFTVDADYPLALNTGRLRDQWHTMTRTGNVPRLMANAQEPVVDIHPADAAAHRLKEGDLAHLSTRFGFVRAKVRVTDAQQRGQAFLPMHWSGQFAARASAGLLSSPVTDPHSGQPELKHVPARIVRENTGWAGVLITRRDLRPTGFVHWSRYAVEGGWVYELTGTEPPDQGILLARKLLGVQRRDQLLEYTDRRGLAYRAAAIDERRRHGRSPARRCSRPTAGPGLAGVAVGHAPEAVDGRSPCASVRPLARAHAGHRPCRVRVLPCRRQSARFGRGRRMRQSRSDWLDVVCRDQLRFMPLRDPGDHRRPPGAGGGVSPVCALCRTGWRSQPESQVWFSRLSWSC